MNGRTFSQNPRKRVKSHHHKTACPNFLANHPTIENSLPFMLQNETNTYQMVHFPAVDLDSQQTKGGKGAPLTSHV